MTIGLGHYLAVAAILEAVGDGTATLVIDCLPVESGTQAHVYARVPADAARTLTDEHPLTRDESLLWPLWTGTVSACPVTITTPIALPSRRQAAHPEPLPVEPLRDGSHQT